MAERRIVVGFDSASDALLAELAVALAQALEAELSAVFVEGLEALHLAALPFAALVEHSGQLYPLDQAHVDALLRAAATRTERELARAAGRARVPASFSIRRGRFLGELASEAGGRDLVVMGSARHGPRRTRAGGLLAVASLASRDIERLLDVAAAVAGEREPLIAVVSDAAQRELVSRWAEQHERTVHLMTVPSAEPEVVARALAPLGPRMLVAGDGDWFLERRADELRRELDCPLVIVR